MCPAPAHDVGKVHEIGGRRGRRWLLGNGSPVAMVAARAGECWWAGVKAEGGMGGGVVVMKWGPWSPANWVVIASCLVMGIVVTEVGLDSVEFFFQGEGASCDRHH